jgi:serine/threonine-protein kinase
MSAALPPPRRPTPEQLPARIGAFPVRGVIGTGSMGVVYLGHDPVIGRPVAIKTIQRHLLEAAAKQHSAAARFRVEAQAAGRLSHRNIVSIYQFGEDPACAYIVMEYVAGHSLSEYLRRPERLGKEEILCLMFQLLDALHYAHEAGVVHRDIKPANLMVDAEGRLKVTDFGIARTESSQVTRVNAVVGSPGYMAPEQYTGGVLDRRVDVFSSGVLLYQLLTGALPFTGTDESIMYQIVYGQHEPVSKRTGNPALAAFDAVIDGALAKAPGQRYSTAWEFRDALRALAGAPVPERISAEHLLPQRTIDSPATLAPGGTATTTVVTRSVGEKPPSVPVPTGWDESQLQSLERELAQLLGPVARVLVRRAAKGQDDIDIVRSLVAASIQDYELREKFLARQTEVPRPSQWPSSRFGPTSVFADTRPAAPREEMRLRPDDPDKAAIALARTLGPIAKVVVKRCAEGATTREQFVARILEQLVARVDAKELEAELWRSLT